MYLSLLCVPNVSIGWVNPPLRTAFTVSLRSQNVVLSLSITSRKRWIPSLVSSVTHWPFRNVLLIFQQLLPFLEFLPSLVPNFSAQWPDSTHGMISVFLYLLQRTLMTSVWSTSESTMCCWEECVLGCRVGGIFSRYLLSPYVWGCGSALNPLVSFLCSDLPLCESTKSCTMSV